MSSKKRFYLQDYPLHNDKRQPTVSVWDDDAPAVGSADGPAVIITLHGEVAEDYVPYLCDLLNKGHEATENEATQQRLYESCLKIESGEIQPKESKPLGPARTWGHENIPAGKRFYRLNNFNGWWDSILILDSSKTSPEKEPVSNFYVGLSEEHTEETSAYVDELLERLNGEATEAER